MTHSPLRIALVAALDEGNLIGADGGMPWHVPEELRYFRRLTLGHSMIMGRNTFDAIGKVLDGRHTIVLTRDASWAHDGAVRAGRLAEALDLARDAASAGFDAAEVMVVGGAQVYALTLAHAQRLYLTRMHARFDGDAYFPEFAADDWRVTSSEYHAPAASRSFAMSYQVLDRVGQPAPVAA